VLVVQLLFHEQLVVKLEPLQLVQVVQVVQSVPVLLVQELLQLVQALLPVVAPLELVEHLCLVQQNSQENLAYLL
jgi:hypothetical protein